MKKIYLLILLLGACSFIKAQQNAFRSFLEFDTILYQVIDHPVNKSLHEIYFTCADDSIYIVSNSTYTGFDFHVTVYDANRYKPIRSFTLKNNREPSHHVEIIGFDSYKNIYALLTNEGWLIYQGGILISDYITKQHKGHFSEHIFDEISIVNDSIIVLGRTYKYSGIKVNETVRIMYYDFIHHKEVKSINIPTELPELGYLKPNHHLSYYNDKVYAADFDTYKVYEVGLGQDTASLVIQDRNAPRSPINIRQIDKARLKAMESMSIGPMLDLIQPYYAHEMFVLNDVSAVNDSLILTRCIRPKNDEYPANAMELWVKESHTKTFKLKRSMPDAIDYEYLNGTDSAYNKNYFQKWTGTNAYMISGNKIVFLIWTSPVYPIGLSKSVFQHKHDYFISKNSSVPAMVIYEFKDTFYK